MSAFGQMPTFVRQEFEDYLECGLLEHGFLRVNCDGCRHEHLVAFSCKRRGFCPSSLNFELMGWIDHPELRGRIRHELHMNIYKAFSEAGIKVLFPQQDVHIRSMPEQ